VCAAVRWPLTWFVLSWRLLGPELTLIEETGQHPSPRFSRTTVRLYLDLLISAGLVVENTAAGTLRLKGRARALPQSKRKQTFPELASAAIRYASGPSSSGN
jgi:hypothetical protein